jgi:hypothetical protein
MSASATIVGLALLGLSSTALASDLDEIAPFGQADTAEKVGDGPEVQSRRGGGGGGRGQASGGGARSHSNTKSRGDASITRSHATNGKGQTIHRVTATNGDRTVTMTRGSSTRTNAAGDTRTQTRGEIERSNGVQGGSRTTRPPGAPPRPVASVRPDAQHRPAPGRPDARPVAHGRPDGHRPVVVARGGPHRHVVRYRHVRPYHGVFVYGPRPATHVHYVHETGPVRVVRDDLPVREVDREGSVALGIRGGSLISGSDGYVVGDPGLGGFLRIRPEESVGLEMAVSHHGGRFPSTETRAQTQVAGSLELFAFPWTRVSPYVLGGATWNARSEIDETWNGESYTTLENSYKQWGLHGGLGLELALGKSAAIDLETRAIGWLDREPGDAPLALQATAGLLFHF